MLNKSAKRIGIDCRFWGISHAGLGRYTRELVLEVVRMCSKDIQFTLFFRGDEWRKDKQALSKCQIIETNVPHYSVYKEQFELKNIIEREHLDLMHFTHFNVPVLLKTPYIVTIHDLIKHFFKGRPVTTHSLPVYWAKYGGYRLVIHQAIKRSKAIIVPSYFTKDQLAVHYQGSENKVEVVYEGVGEPFNIVSNKSMGMADKIQNKYAIKKPFFIYTGSAYASKNVVMLLKAFKQVLHNGHDIELVIACARNHFWEKLKSDVDKLGLNTSVLLPGSVPDDDLVCLYQSSIAFVMPSLMEGFGLPALEAMASGSLVLSSNTGSLPEIYGNHAIYFNPTNLEKMTSCLEHAISLGIGKRKTRIESASQYARSYTWEKAAEQTVHIYKTILNELGGSDLYSFT